MKEVFKSGTKFIAVALVLVVPACFLGGCGEVQEILEMLGIGYDPAAVNGDNGEEVESNGGFHNGDGLDNGDMSEPARPGDEPADPAAGPEEDNATGQETQTDPSEGKGPVNDQQAKDLLSSSQINTVTVDVDVLRLRSGPGTDYQIKDRLKRNAELQFLGRQRSTAGEVWLEVITPGGDNGWVHGDYVTANSIPDPAYGSIRGTLSYPSDYIPPLRVAAFRQDRPATYYIDTVLHQRIYQIDGLPPGTYHVVSYFMEMGLSGGYTQHVLDGLQYGFDDHTLLDVEVRAGSVTAQVDPMDWYVPQDEDIFPPPPE